MTRGKAIELWNRATGWNGDWILDIPPDVTELLNVDSRPQCTRVATFLRAWADALEREAKP